jgi:hypothetical protein
MRPNILWHVDPLLGNAGGRSSYTTAIMSNGFKSKHVCTATFGNSNRGTAFSLHLCRDVMNRTVRVSQLRVASWSNELVVRQSQVSKNVNTQAEDITGVRHHATTSEDRKL